MRNMLARNIAVIFFAVSASLSSPFARGVVLEFVPSSSTVPLGQQAFVDVFISETIGGAAPSIGGYDLDVSFDAVVLSIADVLFDTFLGQPLSLVAFDLTVPGLVDFAEVALLSPGDLDALQPDRFRLATLVFDTIAVGTSPLLFSDALVSDSFGEALTVETRTGSVRVFAVPTPSTLALLAIGLAAVVSCRLKRRC